MSTAAKFLTDRAHVCLFALRTHTHAHLAVRQFFKENCNDDSTNGAEMIDETLTVFRNNPKFRRRFQAQPKTGHMAFTLQAHCSRQSAPQRNPPPQTIFAKLRTHPSNLDA